MVEAVADGGRALDEVAANATVAPVTRLVDGWLAKAAPDLPFRRANAVLPAVGAGADASAAHRTLDALEAWYRSLGRPVIIQVSEADPAAAALDALLAGRGYVVDAPVDVLVAGVAPVAEAGERAADGLAVALAERGGPGPVALVVDEGADETWARRYGAVHGHDERWRVRTEAYGRMLASLGPAVLAGAAVVGGADGGGPIEVAGIGFVVLERGWAGVFGMGTAPGWRRLGVAGSLLGALAVEARRRGATSTYLQVEVDNEPARRRYASLGYRRAHGYHYRVSGPAVEEGC